MVGSTSLLFYGTQNQYLVHVNAQENIYISGNVEAGMRGRYSYPTHPPDEKKFLRGSIDCLCPTVPGLVCKPGSPGTSLDGFIPHTEKGGETPRESVFLRVADTAL